jgi:hypothetical protein
MIYTKPNLVHNRIIYMTVFQILIIAPVYNESEKFNTLIARLIEEWRSALEIVLVDDDSTDSTPLLMHAIFFRKLGLFMLFLSLIYFIYNLFKHFVLTSTPEGYTSLLGIIALLGGVQLLSMSIIRRIYYSNFPTSKIPSSICY